MISCLWSAGFIANRREVAAAAGLDPSASDDELLLALYRIEGPGVCSRISGPFSWIIWDGHSSRLMATRDRMGIYELFYSESGTTLLLAPTIKKILPWLSSAEPNHKAVAAQIRGDVPPSGETFYRNVFSVPAGSSLIADLNGPQSISYWKPESQPLLRLPNDDAYGEAFRQILFSVVSEYSTDGDIGIALSGGLDSTTVAAALRRASPGKRFTAFSWSTPELPESDQTRLAEAAAQRLGCQSVWIQADQIWPLSSETAPSPSLASPMVNFFYEAWEFTFQAAHHRGICHIFSGHSGDHLFGGNAFSYPDLLLTGGWSRLFQEIRKHRHYSSFQLPELIYRMVAAPILKAFLPRRAPAEAPPWLACRWDVPEEQVPVVGKLLPGRQERLRILRDPLLPWQNAMMTQLAANQGIEFRHPLLDHRLFEFAASLPTHQTFQAGVRKGIVRNAMRGVLPGEILERRGKIYPAAIAHRGLRERETAKVWALMTNMRAAEMGFVDEAKLREEYQRYLDGKTQSTLFWHTLTLEAWLRLYF